MSRYIRIVSIVMAILVAMLATSAFAARTLTGDGELPFPAGSNVVGAVISFDDGSVVYGCHIFNSALGGRVKNGVIDPWVQEATKFPPCFGPAGAQAAPPASTGAAALGIDGQPRLLTSDNPDNRLPFAQGDAVVGGYIEMNGQGQGPCSMSSAPTNGVVAGGVVHAWEGELSKFPPCVVDGAVTVQAAAPPAPPTQPAPAASAPQQPSDPASDTDSRRRETGVGQWLEFKKGDSVAGAYLVLYEPNGDTDRKSCYFDSAPFDGKVNTGVLFPKESEKAGMSACK